MAQAVKVLAEAEAYDGPSLIIGYAPCELHGVKGGMNHCQDEMKKAVAAGYWNLFSFNPALKAEGKNPFTLTSKPGDGTYQEFLNNETRYSRLTRSFPERAAKLFAKNQKCNEERYEYLNRLIAFLEHLNPDIAVERLFSRIPEKDAVFCNWNTSWWKLRDELLLRMEEQNSFQGKKLNYLDGAALRLLDNKE